MAEQRAAKLTEKVLSLEVRPRGTPIRNMPKETYVRLSDTGKDIYYRVAAKSRFDLNRLRITKASDGSLVPNDADVTVEALELYEGSGIFVKDLGPQIAWRTVFIIEYLGPLLIHPLVYLLRNYIYENPHGGLTAFPEATLSAKLSLAMIVIHFAKRELETMFVHRFSAATMPAFNIFKNSAHYWLLAGFNIALFTYSPSDESPTSRDPTGAWAWLIPASIALFVIGELGNLSAHLTLRGLRGKGTKDRGIPVSGVFRWVPVTCPNYFFETLAWIGIGLANRSLSTALFAVIAVGQMAVWARKKERRYRREFGGRYKAKRFSMLPGIV